MSNEERSRFLSFVSARTRLPRAADSNGMHLKIQPAPGGDASLPRAQSCFNSLQLPKYTSTAGCKAKLLYAITHCRSMEDFALSDRRGFEAP